MEKSSDTGGVKPMSIAGRLINERERLLGMTEAERAFRKQWLKDQELALSEPKKVPEIYKATYNPIRRFYRWPLNQLESALTPAFGPIRAGAIRHITAKLSMGVAFTYWMYYYFKYNSNSWEKKGGLRAFTARESVLPGDPGYPFVPVRTKGADYASRGFNQVSLDL